MKFQALIFCCFTAFLSLFTSCQNDEVLPDEIIIYQEGNNTITLTAINDSRCPINATCVWAGNGEVLLTFDNGSETADFKLNTAGYSSNDQNYPSSATVLGVTIELLNLLPYPEVGETYYLDDYTLELVVTE
ncbi:MAG: hypothetical protein GYB31_13880 [Bacteroidetes bacterium]|nr:hypothetical protein [Bacteroidota bacterium]